MARACPPIHPVTAPELAQHRLAEAQSMVQFRALAVIARKRAIASLGGAVRPLRAIGLRLDPLHVVVGEAEMVADLVDQHMAH